MATFQAYLDNIKAKTGKTGDDFKALAAEKNLTKTSDILAWLKSDFGLGRGHGMAITHLIVNEEQLNSSADEKTEKLFSGSKGKWRKPFDEMIAEISGFGDDVSTSAGQTYANLLRGGKKFGIVQPSASRLDIGIKLKGENPNGRFEAAGTWNEMVTHRVRVSEPGQIDRELIGWLKRAYLAC